MRSTTYCIAVFLALTLGFAGIVQAITIHHSLFENIANDNFEHQATGPISNGAGALPALNPGPGSWFSNIAVGGGTTAEAEVLSGGAPGAAQGDQYVRGEKDGLYGAGNVLSLVVDLNDDITPTSDGVLTSRFSVYIDSQGSGSDESVLYALKVNSNGTGYDMAFLDFFENGRLKYGDSLSTAGDVADAFTPDAWHSVELQYTVVSGNGNDTWSFAIWNTSTGEETFSDSNISSAVDSNRPIRGAAFFSGNFSQWYIDGFVTPPPTTVETVASSDIVVEDTAGIGFQSEAGVEFRLQSTPDLVSSNFTDTGAFVTGDGGEMSLFDPTGTSSAKKYRVVR